MNRTQIIDRSDRSLVAILTELIKKLTELNSMALVNNC
jgi:hypothetical protein